MTFDHDVTVIGFGPAGAVCAGLLGRLGVSTLVIDKAHDVYDKPRAFALDHEIMRVFQNLGLAGEIAPHTAPFTPSEYYGVDGQLIKRLGSIEPPYPLGWPPNMVFTQPPVEAALRTGAATHPSVHVELGTELVGLEQTAAGVRLELRDDSGRTRTVASRYAIGCDGASSTVRALQGMALEDLTFDEPWLVVDVHINEQGAAKLPKVSVQYCDPSRPATYLIGPRNHRRWEIMVMPGEDRRELEDDAHVWSLLSRWITPADGTLWRKASYRFHALVANEWRRDRVFIAGDAAHQQPPFTGQGMCQGVRDVANQRRQHVKRLTSTIKELGKVICERDPEVARERDRKLLREAGGVIATVPRQNLIPPIEGGFLSPLPHAANETIFPQPNVRHGADDQRLDDVAGTGFRIVVNDMFDLAGVRGDLIDELDARVVVIGDRSGDDGPGFALRGSGVALHVVERDSVVERWFDRYSCSCAIVRPDHYVYGVAANARELNLQLESIAAIIGDAAITNASMSNA